MIRFPSHLAQALSAQEQERKRRNMTWQAVQEEVLNRIQNGEWPEGGLIPTEAELATEFGCARATVNRALQTLAQSGVLERRRKVGTRVAQHPRVQMVRTLLRREIEASGKVYGYALLDCRECSPPADVAQAMLLRTEDVLLRVQARFSADGALYCCEERWINNYATPGLTREVLEEMSPCEWLLGHVPINRGSMAMAASRAGEDFVSLALELDPADPVLLLERVDWLGNMPVSLTRRYFPETHRFTATI
ncbi:GntR family transcriptional regulator [Paracoccus binzhouensis]|uniref:GntR family transcriptional regulator n=1 Tax=Paracoccus binzhouensis TaxID=2796149 RepID=UPI0018EF24F8|nr:GntR family transcriptional regulator [Paracoccus binzhouensis]